MPPISHRDSSVSVLSLPVRPPRSFWRRLWWWVIRFELTVRLVPITDQHRNELDYIDNAFLTDATAGPLDFQYFVWRLHPDFIRPNGEMPNQTRPGERPHFATWAQRRRAVSARYVIGRLIPHVEPKESEIILRRWLAASDKPNRNAPPHPVNHFNN